MIHANTRHRAAVRLAGRRPLGINPALRAWRPHKKPRVETREHDPREPAASCRGSLGGPPPAWNQPGPPGLAPAQKAPGGNPGTPGMNTTPQSMPDDRTQLPGSNPHRMALGKACHPESPGSRRGLFVEATRVPKSPGWKPGDTGYEHHPAVHAGWPHAIARFKPTSHGTREGMPPGVPRLPPGAFCAVRACQAERMTGERATAEGASQGNEDGRRRTAAYSLSSRFRLPGNWARRTEITAVVRPGWPG
jgi:hypothetical protein